TCVRASHGGSDRRGDNLANAPGPLLPGAVRGASFHPRGPPLRRLTTLADPRRQRARAGAGGRTVSPKALDHPHRARARVAALPGRDRAQRGSRPRGCTVVDASSGRQCVRPASVAFGAKVNAMEVPSRGGETILMVEDDELVRTSVQSLIESLGYRVVSARNSRDAVE